MDSRDVARGISRSWTFARRLTLDETFSNPAPLAPREEFRRLSQDDDVTYEAIYLRSLESVYYNFLLKDFSFFQFWVNGEGETRFAYYPNPFLGASRQAMAELAQMREYVEEGLISQEDYLHSVSDQRRSQHPPLIRYESARSQYVELAHPCSHFHFGHHGENRWPVKRELTPVAFSLLIYRQFYGTFWAEHAAEVDDKTPDLESCMATEKAGSRILGAEWFSERESLQFHFM